MQWMPERIEMTDEIKTRPGLTLVESKSIKAREEQVAHIEHEIKMLEDRKWLIQHEILLMGGEIAILERMKHIIRRFL